MAHSNDTVHNGALYKLEQPVPAWTPRCLLPTIRWLTSQPLRSDHADILARLLIYPRMEKLTRRDRMTGGYRYPARPPAYAPRRDQDGRQAAAMGETLHLVFRSASDGRIVTTTEETALFGVALLRDAHTARRFAAEAVSAAEVNTYLHTATRKEDEAASLRGEGDPGTVERHRSDRRFKGIEVDVTEFFKTRFGHPLRRTAQTLAEVALGM